MKQSFTLNQCVRLLYKETTPEESYMLKEVIEQNTRLKSEYSQMQEAYAFLQGAVIAPARKSVDAVLRYSQNALELC